MAVAFLLAGIVAAVLIVVGSTRLESRALRRACFVLALLAILAGFTMGSVTYVGSDQVGIVSKNALGGRLAGNQIIATDGEMGVQAEVLSPGWHVGYWPVVFAVRTEPLTQIQSDEIGIIETSDGAAMGPGQLFAPEWKDTELKDMLDAKHFLTTGKGFKGKQTSVLRPGKYRLNTELYRVRMVKQTEVKPGEVAVLTSNFGTTPSVVVRGIAAAADPSADGNKVPEERLLKFAKEGEIGIRADPLPPGKYALNTDAFSVTEIWTTQMIAHYTAAHASNPVSVAPTEASKASARQTGLFQAQQSDEREIKVTTNDGFQFPVDVRVEYYIEPENAPIVVAKLGDDEGDRFRNALNSAVRAIFRNNAEKVKALDYVNDRSKQEEQSLHMLVQQMARFGVTITAVRIGNVGDQETLGKLLDTQTQREIAKQELLTTIEQQKASVQKKELARSTQESEEEKKLATATYAVKIADEDQKKRLIEAQAEAKAVEIKATAQADAYKLISAQIGKSNAALIEVLKIIGERDIQITPRVLVTGATKDGATTALFGTMLDQMMSKEDEKSPEKPAAPAK